MKNSMQSWGYFAIMFLVSFLASSCALGNHKFLQLFHLNEIWKTLSILQLRIIQIMFSTFVGIIPKLWTFLSDKKKNREQFPRLTVSFHSISCVRKSLNYHINPVISLNEGNWFIYVQACISNSGTGEIRNISINGQDIGKAILSPGEKYIVFLRICENTAENFRKHYKFQMDFKDDRELCFTKKISFMLNEKERKAKELQSTKVRRRFGL